MIIGLTGQIGSGKTTAAQILADLGAFIIDADQIGREVVNNSVPLRKRLASKFGPEILDKKGKLNRTKLANLAFKTDQTRLALDKIVHPPLIKELKRQVRIASKQYDTIIIDAALLLNWNFDQELDFIIVTHAGLEIRLKRLKKRGILRADAISRNKRQMAYSVYRERADRVILNNGTTAQLRKKLKGLFRKLTT